MKVWIENPFDNLPAEGYRPQRYWLMAFAFAAAGHDVTLWTSDFSHAMKVPRVLKDHRAPFPLRLVATPPYAQNVSLKRIRSHRAYARNWLAAARAEIAKTGAPELLICSLPPLATVDAALELQREFDLRLVFDVQDAWPQNFLRLVPRSLKSLAALALRPLERTANRAYREADLVTGVCDAYANLVRAAGARDYYRAYLGIELPSASGEKSIARTSTRLVYVGNFGRGSDLAPVIEAVKRRADLTLDLAGSGDREARWRARAGNESRIRFHGYLDQAALGALLNASDIGIIALTDDTLVGLPNKLGDYALHGLRVLTSLHGECAALVERFNLGTVYADADSLLAALDRLPSLQPDFTGLLAELDARRIYPAYVTRVLTALGERPSPRS